MIDESTGLPQLKEGMRWRITRAYGYPTYDGHLKLQKRIFVFVSSRDKEIFGLWRTVKSNIIVLGHSQEAIWSAQNILSDWEHSGWKKRERAAQRKRTAVYLGNYPPKKLS